jgi:hypothetical protein
MPVLVTRRGSRTLEEAEAAMANRAAGNGVKAMPRLAELAAAGPGGDSHCGPARSPEQRWLCSGRRVLRLHFHGTSCLAVAANAGCDEFQPAG